MTSTNFWHASDGTKLHYLEDDFTDPWKKSETIVLIHPGMGSSLRLHGWIPHLARDYRVVRPDIRGHGKSEPALDKPLTNERLARDLIELLDHLKCERAHVIGASAGGMIALHAILRFPARFASLALYAATAGIHPDRPKKGNWLARVAAGGVRQFLTETMHDRIGDASPAHQKWFLDTAEGVTVEHLARFVPLMASEYFPEKLSAVQCPTLMVVPDPDPMVGTAEYELMRDTLPRCRYVTVKGAGHSMVGEIPDRCAQEAKRFIDDVRAGRPL